MTDHSRALDRRSGCVRHGREDCDDCFMEACGGSEFAPPDGGAVVTRIEQRVRGRWELQTIDGFAAHAGAHTVAWGEFVEGKVPVVPCDEAAIERLAQHLSREAGVGFIWTTETSDAFPGIDRTRDRYRERAAKYLRAAGGRS